MCLLPTWPNELVLWWRRSTALHRALKCGNLTRTHRCSFAFLVDRRRDEEQSAATTIQLPLILLLQCAAPVERKIVCAHPKCRLKNAEERWRSGEERFLRVPDGTPASEQNAGGDADSRVYFGSRERTGRADASRAIATEPPPAGDESRRVVCLCVDNTDKKTRSRRRRERGQRSVVVALCVVL